MHGIKACLFKDIFHAQRSLEMGKHCFNHCLATLFSYMGLFLAFVIWVHKTRESKAWPCVWLSAASVCLDVERSVCWPWNRVYPAFSQGLFGVCLEHICLWWLLWPVLDVIVFEEVVLVIGFCYPHLWSQVSRIPHVCTQYKMATVFWFTLAAVLEGLEHVCGSIKSLPDLYIGVLWAIVDSCA